MELPLDVNNHPVQVFRLGTTQKLTAGAASAPSNAFGAGTKVIRVVAAVAVHIAIGAAPVATANDALVTANLPELFAVSAGEKIAILQDASGGSVFVSELY